MGIKTLSYEFVKSSRLVRFSTQNSNFRKFCKPIEFNMTVTFPGNLVEEEVSPAEELSPPDEQAVQQL